VWRLLDEKGQTHLYKNKSKNDNLLFRRKKVVDISIVTIIEEAKQLIKLGWE
jgi:hypothetical protein